MPGESINVAPLCIGEVILAVESIVEMPPLPVKTKTFRELSRKPEVNVTAIGDKQAELLAQRLGISDQTGKLHLGDAAEIIEGNRHNCANNSRRVSRSFSR